MVARCQFLSWMLTLEMGLRCWVERVAEWVKPDVMADWSWEVN